MAYKCIECGAEFEYKPLLRSKLKCTSCREKRSNVWIKKRPDDLVKEVYAR